MNMTERSVTIEMKKTYTAPELEVFIYESDSDIMDNIGGSYGNEPWAVPGNPLLPYGNMDDVYELGDEDDD